MVGESLKRKFGVRIRKENLEGELLERILRDICEGELEGKASTERLKTELWERT